MSFVNRCCPFWCWFLPSVASPPPPGSQRSSSQSPRWFTGPSGGFSGQVTSHCLWAHLWDKAAWAPGLPMIITVGLASEAFLMPLLSSVLTRYCCQAFKMEVWGYKTASQQRFIKSILTWNGILINCRVIIRTRVNSKTFFNGYELLWEKRYKFCL